MLYLWVIILIVLNTVFLAMVPFVLPGNWLMVITASLFAWLFRDQQVFSVYTIIAIALLALAGELIEFLAGVGGARKSGASRRGSICAITGAIAGAILGTFLLPVPLLGTLLGSCIGAGLSVYSFELFAGRKSRQSFHAGAGASLGQFLGSASKSLIGIIIWFTIAIAAFWP